MNNAVRAVAERGLSVPCTTLPECDSSTQTNPAPGLEIDVSEISVNNVAILHGGLVPLLLDVASHLAVLEQLEPGTNTVTASVSASLLTGVAFGYTMAAAASSNARGA